MNNEFSCIDNLPKKIDLHRYFYFFRKMIFCFRYKCIYNNIRNYRHAIVKKVELRHYNWFSERKFGKSESRNRFSEKKTHGNAGPRFYVAEMKKSNN